MFQMLQLMNLSGMIYLLYGTLKDLRTGRIPMWYLVAGTVAAIAARIIMPERSWAEYCLGGAAGLLFMLFSHILKDKLGYGDSWMIGILGIYFGILQLMGVLFLAFLSSAFTAVYCMAKKKYSRHTVIPFYPFLLLGYIGGILL